MVQYLETVFMVEEDRPTRMYSCVRQLVSEWVSVCVCACVRACVRAFVRARACVCMRAHGCQY